MSRNYTKINHHILTELSKLMGENAVFTSKEVLEKYSRDSTENLSFLPEVVVKPRTAQEIAALLKYANENCIPVTPRGAGTGLSGGALPVFGGISLSLERLNKILKIDEENMQVMVEPGVITEELQNILIEKGLFYPPDPSSKGSCFIGGNLAENAGGPRATKYGVTSNYVLNLEVVLPNGEIIWTGANTLKNVTAYNLTQLMIGSEGTLGVITKAVFRLLPHPPLNFLLLVPFYNLKEAAKAVSEIFMAGLQPSALELMERSALIACAEYLGNLNVIEIPEQVEAHLLIEVDGYTEEELYKSCEEIERVLKKFNHDHILFADNEIQKNQLWQLRRSTNPAIRTKYKDYHKLDTVVPRAQLPELIEKVKEIDKHYGSESICFGHAGDGNLHINILKGNMNDRQWVEELPKAYREIFSYCGKLGGTITAEHGVGMYQMEYIDTVLSKANIELQKNIKKTFDPNYILNPGKIFLE